MNCLVEGILLVLLLAALVVAQYYVAVWFVHAVCN